MINLLRSRKKICQIYAGSFQRFARITDYQRKIKVAKFACGDLAKKPGTLELTIFIILIKQDNNF